MKYVIAAIAVGFVATLAYWTFVGSPDPDSETVATAPGEPLAEVIVPEIVTANAQIGEQVYTAACSECHGRNAAGQDGVAPPLVHIIYEPSHHGDEAFQRAVAVGVRAHHWRFGNMSPVEGLTRGDVAMVIAYIRELQQANGIN